MSIHTENYVIPINTELIKDTVPCLPLVLDPDIIAVPIDSKVLKEGSINFINAYEEKIPEKSSELIIWGFPNNGNRITLFESYDINVLTDLFVIVDGKSYTDHIHYCIEVKDKTLENMSGFSGGPVFLKDSNSNKFVFVGILVGTHKDANGLYVVQLKYLYDLIN